jgi:hypothetical protein
MTGKTIEQYFADLKDITSQLAAIGERIPDSKLVQIVMKALPDGYDSFLQHYTTAGCFPTMTELQNNLLLEESHRQVRVAAKTEKALYFRGAPLPPRKYFGPPTRYSSSATQPQTRYSGSNGGGCNYCGALDHWIRLCPEWLTDIRKLEANCRIKLQQ